MRLLLLALALSGAPHSEHERNAAANSARAAQEPQRGSDTFPISVKLLNTGKTKAEVQQETERVEQDRLLARRTYRLNALLVIATIITLAVLGYQSYWLRRDVMLSEKHTRIQLRAYVRAKVEILNPTSGRIRLENVGKTPAREVRAQTILYNGPKSQFKHDVWALHDIPEATLGQGDITFQSGVVPVLTPEDVAQIAKGDPHWIFIVGRAEYVDVFGERWYTDYGFDLSFATVEAAAPGAEVMYSKTPGHNQQS